MSRPNRLIPPSASEAAECAFWQTHDSTEFLDGRLTQPAVFPNPQLDALFESDAV